MLCVGSESAMRLYASYNGPTACTLTHTATYSRANTQAVVWVVTLPRRTGAFSVM